MAFVTAIGDIFPLVTAIADTNVSNGCDNGAVTIRGQLALLISWIPASKNFENYIDLDENEIHS